MKKYLICALIAAMLVRGYSETEKVRSRAAKCNCTAMVGEDIVAEAQLKFMLVDDEMV